MATESRVVGEEASGYRSSSDNRRAAVGGIIAGLIGGLFLALFMFVVNAATGQDRWIGAKLAALPFLGAERVMRPGFEAGPVLLGVLSHFAVSAAWGLLFGLIFYGVSKVGTVAAGALWGVVVWLGMFYVVLPVIGAGQLARSAPVGIAVFEHVLFGIAVGLGFLPFQRVRPRAERPLRRRVPVTP